MQNTDTPPPPLEPYTPHCGSGTFLEFVERRHLLVDKTLFVKSFLECPYGVPLITRPRRWGKTFNLGILEAFFSIPATPQGEVDQAVVAKRRAIFEKFQIGQEKKLMDQYLGQYPVIFLTFKSIKEGTYRGALTQLQELFSEAYQRHVYLLESARLTSKEKERFRSYLDQIAPDAKWPLAIKFLMKLLARHWGKRVMLLIDEYDTPFNMLFAQKILRERSLEEGSKSSIDSLLEGEGKAQEDLLQRLLSFFQVFLGDCLKGSEDCLEKAVVTGILRIAKANLFSSVNNLGEFSILDLRPKTSFLRDFGFTFEEVEKLLKQGWNESFSQEKPLEEWLQDVQDWYNGYTLAGVTFYNPWSIASWFANHGDLRPYWVQTASDDLLKVALWEGLPKPALQRLLAQREVQVFLQPTFSLSDLEDPGTRESLIWTLLVFAGYLSPRQEPSRTSHWVRIPNQEIRFQFEDLVSKRLRTLWGRKLEEISPWILSLGRGDVETFCAQFQRHLAETASFYHTRKEPQHFSETFYHGLVMGASFLLRDLFVIESERESGEGRLDLLLLGKPGTTAAGWGYLFEFKVGGTPEQLETEVKAAVRQIREQDYERRLSEWAGTAKVWRVAMAFSGKTLKYAFRLHGQTDADEIRELAGEYYQKEWGDDWEGHWEELMQGMQKGVQMALQRGDFQASADLGQRLKRLDDLKKQPR